jgi:hypothetical protein
MSLTTVACAGAVTPSAVAGSLMSAFRMPVI